jgi:nucleoside-diphosphate-sugar epimerase
MKDRFHGRRIALIGGAGFIGHNLALHLQRQGASVHIIDSLQVNNLLAFQGNSFQGAAGGDHRLYARFIDERLNLLRAAGIGLFIQDSRDYHALSRLLSDIAPEVVVHLAAISHAGKSNKDPYNTFDHSLRTLENALDWSRGNAEHFIFLSSSMAYGDFQTPSVDEDHALSPIGIYGALKVAGEKIVIAYQQVFELPYTIIRPSALYGPRCVSRRVGQVFIENALQGKSLRVEGDGGEKIDFTYIDDLTEGLALVIEKPEARNQVFNLTYGHARTILELAQLVRQEFPNAPLEFVGRDRLMPFRGTLSVEKARRLLDYQPRFPIEKGMPEYIRWYRTLLGN